MYFSEKSFLLVLSLEIKDKGLPADTDPYVFHSVTNQPTYQPFNMCFFSRFSKENKNSWSVQTLYI